MFGELLYGTSNNEGQKVNFHHGGDGDWLVADTDDQ